MPKFDREEVLKCYSRKEFLASRGLNAHIKEICGTEDKDFPRAFELLNRMNQFNKIG